MPILLAAGLAVPFIPLRPAVAILAGGLALAIAGTRLGAQRLALGMAMLMIPPGLVGETSSYLSVAAFAVIGFVVARTPGDEDVEPWRALRVLLVVAAAAFVYAGIALNQRSYVAIGVLYVAAMLVVRQFEPRVEMAEQAARAVVALVVAECVSYWISLLAGFPFGAHDFALKGRHVDVYAPLTFTSGSHGYWPSIPRFSLFSGEPGLAGVVLLIAAAYAVVLYAGRKRLVLLALLGSGVAFTQSSGAVLAAAVFVVVACAVHLTRRLTPLPAAILSAAPVFAVSKLATGLIHAKLADNATSVNDRGLLGGSFTGDISLRAMLSHHAYLALPMIALLLAYAIRAGRDPLMLGLIAAVALVAWSAQPLHDHPGVWVLVGVLAVSVKGKRHLVGDDFVVDDGRVSGVR